MVTRIKKQAEPMPQNVAEADKLLGELGVAVGAEKQLEADRQKEVDAVIEKYKAQLEVAANARKDKFKQIYNFSQVNRSSLIDKIKTAFWKNGTITWRFTPPKVSSKLSEETLIELLKSNGMGKYIRIKEEVNRELLLQDKPNISGISYTSIEEFVAKPKYVIDDENKTMTVTEIVKK